MTLVTITARNRVWEHATYDTDKSQASPLVLRFLDEEKKEVHIVGMPYVIEEE